MNTLPGNPHAPDGQEPYCDGRRPQHVHHP